MLLFFIKMFIAIAITAAIIENIAERRAVVMNEPVKSLAKPPISGPAMDAAITTDVCIPSSFPMLFCPNSFGIRSICATGSPPNARNLSQIIETTASMLCLVKLIAKNIDAASTAYSSGRVSKTPRRIAINPHAKAPTLCSTPDTLMTIGT